MNLPRLLLRLLGRRLPITDGSLTVHGIDRRIAIGRDRFGVPHIEAATEHDAWFGLGFCQGQDRAFQLDIRARLVRGTLAALIGEDALPLDRLSRRIDFAGYGHRGVHGMEDEDRTRLEAFAAGVRSGVRSGRGGRAHEFVLLRSSPIEFEASDALGFLAVQAFALASNWDVELARLGMLALDGPEAVEALHPPYRADQPVSDRPGEAAGRLVDSLAADLAAARHLLAPGGGSNNWAVAGHKSASGRPILANDPHLAPILPAHWYLARVAGPEWTVVGGVIPGTPAFGFGHNGTAAWGVTAGLIDNTDLFVEEIGPDGLSVRRADEFVRCDRRLERIAVKGGEDEEIEILTTDRGPIVGPAFEGDFGALSMSATWLRPGRLGAVFELPRVRSFDALHEAFRGWSSVPLNVAYADRSEIGWQLIGSSPLRGSGAGTIPLAAADASTAWRSGEVPYDDLPHTRDPATGFVATANNLPSVDGPYLGSDFLDGYRAQRIAEVLEARDDWDVDATLALQMDQSSIPWRSLRPQVLRAAAVDGGLGAVVNVLRAWNGVVAPDSPAAAVFEVFTAEMCRAVAEVKAPNSSHLALGEGFSPLVPFNTLLVRRVSHVVTLLEQRPAGWFEDGWDEAIRSALRAARDLLTDRHGPDPRDWAWGEIRPLTLVHPMGLRRPLDRIWNIGPIPHGGDANTVNPAPVDPRDPLAAPQFAIASGRMVVQIDAWDHARFCLAGGQSGNPYSPHYADQVSLWRRGDALVVPFTPKASERVLRRRLELVPA